MPPSRHSRLVILLLPVIALVCLGLLLGANAVVGLQDRAESLFGPPAAGLSTTDRLRLSALILWQSESLLNPINPAGPPRAFTVTAGEPVAGITDRLQSAGLIDNPRAFRYFLQYAGLDVSLQAGDYELSPAMSAVDIARAMQDATPARVTFRVLAGWRLEEVAASLPTSGLSITPGEFILLAQRPPARLTGMVDLPFGAPLEGYLFPDAYELDRSLTAEQLVRTLVENFRRQVNAELRTGFARRGLTLHEGVILASIVSREAVIPEEAPLIASVFLNRLAIRMKLDADPTVQYALGYNPIQETWWTNPLSIQDLEVDSPYNTYQRPGLPPGPIANPGLESLRAVAFPAQSPYYYFRAACDGSGRHMFAETFEEHKGNACP